jgi:hypothetical protein
VGGGQKYEVTVTGGKYTYVCMYVLRLYLKIVEIILPNTYN